MTRLPGAISTLEPRFAAQRLAFAPLVFQACRVLRDVGLLAAVGKARGRGLTAAEGAQACGVSPYAAALLLEAGYAAELCACEPAEEAPRFTLTPTGAFWLHDPLTRANADFNHHVCYRAAFHLGDALREGRPAGLAELDATGAATVYEALRTLSPEVRGAWFGFDHYYSDGVFDACLPRVLEGGHPHVVDIGGNTGRFARRCVEAGAARVTLVDLPGQVATASAALADLGARVAFVPGDVRAETTALPQGADVYWLSQFLDCFGEADIVAILSRVRRAMGPSSRLFVLETFWDLQRHEAARFCVIGTSLYFACVANGTSRMYHSRVFQRLAREAGLSLVAETPEVGLSHTLLEYAARPDAA